MRWLVLVLLGCSADGPGRIGVPDDADTHTDTGIDHGFTGPTIAATFVPTTAANHSGLCAVVDGWVACRDRNFPDWAFEFDQLVPPDGADFVGLRASARAMWGLRSDGTVTVWGDTSGVTSVLLDLPGFVVADTFAVAASHACWTRAGEVACYGHDTYGQVSGAPDGPGWVQAEVGDSWSCALHETGALDCWGEGVEDAPRERFTRISGQCGVGEDDRLTCWGRDDQRQARWADGRTVDDWARGHRYVCTLRDGVTQCSGGDSTWPVPTPLEFERLVGGPDYVCGVTYSGLWACWGTGTEFPPG